MMQVMEDGSLQPLKGKTDWARLDAMTEEEIEANALSDPDNPPMTDEEAQRLDRFYSPDVKAMRQGLKLSQIAFALRYHLSLHSLRDWEQGRSRPDHGTCAYLAIIRANPKMALKLLRQGYSL
jgi:putative transcriptional regulator